MLFFCIVINNVSAAHSFDVFFCILAYLLRCNQEVLLDNAKSFYVKHFHSRLGQSRGPLAKRVIGQCSSEAGLDLTEGTQVVYSLKRLTRKYYMPSDSTEEHTV